MNEVEQTTLHLILSAAMQEFLEKGFKSASLRNIVKTAGVTTGALYGYYDSKEALFAALVDEGYRYILGTYTDALNEFEQLSPARQCEEMGQVGGDCMRRMLLYMDARRDVFHLLLECAGGTAYARLVDELVALEVGATDRYVETLRRTGKTVPEIDRKLEHILVTGMMNAYFEIIIHDMPLPDAERYLAELNAFYTAGWAKVMGQ